jgi:hypothetical protein
MYELMCEFVSCCRRTCSYILLPAENTWNRGVRGFLYLFALLYSFLGIAIVSDVFMASIETITSKKVKVRLPILPTHLSLYT